MPVLLNGGGAPERRRGRFRVPLVDACVTEWRLWRRDPSGVAQPVPLVDACVTEWRSFTWGKI